MKSESTENTIRKNLYSSDNNGYQTNRILKSWYHKFEPNYKIKFFFETLEYDRKLQIILIVAVIIVLIVLVAFLILVLPAFARLLQ